jgi:hypothetical protein
MRRDTVMFADQPTTPPPSGGPESGVRLLEVDEEEVATLPPAAASSLAAAVVVRVPNVEGYRYQELSLFTAFVLSHVDGISTVGEIADCIPEPGVRTALVELAARGIVLLDDPRDSEEPIGLVNIRRSCAQIIRE